MIVLHYLLKRDFQSMKVMVYCILCNYPVLNNRWCVKGISLVLLKLVEYFIIPTLLPNQHTQLYDRCWRISPVLATKDALHQR